MFLPRVECVFLPGVELCLELGMFLPKVECVYLLGVELCLELGMFLPSVANLSHQGAPAEQLKHSGTN